MHSTLTLSRNLFSRTTDPVGWDGAVALISALFIPAVAMAEVMLLILSLIRRMVFRCRSASAKALRRAADAIDPSERSDASCAIPGAVAVIPVEEPAWDMFAPSEPVAVSCDSCGIDTVVYNEYPNNGGTLKLCLSCDDGHRWCLSEPQEDVSVVESAPETVEAILDAEKAIPMPSAAQETVAPTGWDEIDTSVPEPLESAEQRAVAEHGSIRAAARALGVAESTLRSRIKKQQRS